jgi:hypothetical protein
MQYGVRPLPGDIRQKRSDPLLGEVLLRFCGPDLVGDGLDGGFVQERVVRRGELIVRRFGGVLGGLGAGEPGMDQPGPERTPAE